MKEHIVLHGSDFLLEELVQIARNKVGIKIPVESESRINKARQLIDKWVKNGEKIYGVTTGFGALSEVTISYEDTRKLQKNITGTMTACLSWTVKELLS